MSGIEEYKCPCCGGAISFDSTIQKMKCPYCDTEFDIDTVKAFNEKNEKQDDMVWDTDTGKEWTEEETEALFSFSKIRAFLVVVGINVLPFCPITSTPISASFMLLHYTGNETVPAACPRKIPSPMS